MISIRIIEWTVSESNSKDAEREMESLANKGYVIVAHGCGGGTSHYPKAFVIMELKTEEAK